MNSLTFGWNRIFRFIAFTNGYSVGRTCSRLACLLLLTFPSVVLAGGVTVENTDRNKLIQVLDVISDGNDTTVLYSTRPERDQPHRSEACAANFYLLKLVPGLSGVEPGLIAENQCTNGLGNARLLASGDMVLLIGDQVEAWRLGEGKVSQWSFGSVDTLQGHWGNVNDSGAFVDVGSDGNLVFARGFDRKRDDTQSPSGLVVGLDSEGNTRWQIELNEPGVFLGIMDVWATRDGGALVHLVARAMDGGAALPGVEPPAGSVVVSQNRLYRISANGKSADPTVIASFQSMDFSNPAAIPDPSSDPEGFQAFIEASNDPSQANAWAEGEVLARPGPGDAMDVMLGAGSSKARLLRIDNSGQVSLDVELTPMIEAEGLSRWVDFVSDSGQIWLFGSLGTRQNRLPQGYVSRIGLPEGPAVTRLAPLSELGLEEAMAAGDEEFQYLQNNPSQNPQRLSSLANHPLTISLVYRSRRQAIQIDEINDQSMAYTEAREQRMAKQAKEEQRAQRKADREASQQAMSSEMASAIGVSDEEYASMSNKERKEAMVRGGDMEAVMAAAMKEAEAAMQQLSAQQGANGAAMTPEMAAAIAQAQQAMAAAGMTMPAASTTGSSEVASDAKVENALLVEPNGHGTIDYEHPDGSAVTLLIQDRESGRELLRKEYADGSIYEYLDFSRYQLPLNQIAVIIHDAKSQQIEEMTPVMVE